MVRLTALSAAPCPRSSIHGAQGLSTPSSAHTCFSPQINEFVGRTFSCAQAVP